MSDGLIFEVSNFFADAIILSIVASKSADGAFWPGLDGFWKRSGLIRAMTNGRRYGLVRPAALSFSITLPTASSSSSTFLARSARSAMDFLIASFENESHLRKTERYATPENRPFSS